MNVGGTVIELADIDAFNVADFRLDWTTVNAAAFQYHYLLIGGDGLEANIVQHLAPTVDDTQVNVAHGLSGVANRHSVVGELHANGATRARRSSRKRRRNRGYGFHSGSVGRYLLGSVARRNSSTKSKVPGPLASHHHRRGSGG